MARSQERETLRGSLLDRLTGKHGANTTFGAIQHRDLKTSLMRDLNWLLNSRAWFPEDLSDYPEARASLLNFGLPDFTSYSWKRVGDQKNICGAIEEAIRAFEPRLRAHTVRVTPIEEDFGGEVSLFVKLRIEAKLNIEPYNEPIAFDTEVEIDSGAISITRAQ